MRQRYFIVHVLGRVGPSTIVIDLAQSISWLDGVKGDLNRG